MSHIPKFENRLFLQKKVGKNSRYFVGVFNKQLFHSYPTRTRAIIVTYMAIACSIKKTTHIYTSNNCQFKSRVFLVTRSIYNCSMTTELPTWPSQHLQQQEEQFLILVCSSSKIACPANSWKASRIWRMILLIKGYLIVSIVGPTTSK